MDLLMSQINDRIRALHLFAALSDDQFAELMAKSRLVSLETSEALFNMGDSASSFFVPTSGKLKLTMNSPQGVEKVLMIVRPFELFAEAVMFMEKQQYPVNSLALQKSDVMCFDSRLFVSFLRSSPDLSLKMLSLLSLRLHKQINEIENLSTQNSTSRVLNYLSSKITDKIGNNATITLDTSKKNLASRLSIAPETFSRVLHKLTLEKIIETDGRQITVCDFDGFRRYLIEQ
jgi:CRP-like cAMP-binding protein